MSLSPLTLKNYPPSFKDISKISSYSEFRKKFLASGCSDCPLCDTRTNLVVDRGNPNSKILVIGEAPGKDEDKMGQCFIGRAGKMLDKIMASIGLDTNKDVLIANVVKCRPPDNRVPARIEVEACRPYLLKQIELLKPKVIIPLGATALKHVFFPKKDFSISKAVGSAYRVGELGEQAATLDLAEGGTYCFALFHPAYMLYDPRKKVDMFRHVQELRKLLIQEKVLPDTPFVIPEKLPF